MTTDRPHRKSELGATAVEYALILVLICGAIIGVVGLFGGAVLGLFQEIPVPFR